MVVHIGPGGEADGHAAFSPQAELAEGDRRHDPPFAVRDGKPVKAKISCKPDTIHLETLTPATARSNRNPPMGAEPPPRTAGALLIPAYSPVPPTTPPSRPPARPCGYRRRDRVSRYSPRPFRASARGTHRQKRRLIDCPTGRKTGIQQFFSMLCKRECGIPQ